MAAHELVKREGGGDRNWLQWPVLRELDPGSVASGPKHFAF